MKKLLVSDGFGSRSTWKHSIKFETTKLFQIVSIFFLETGVHNLNSFALTGSKHCRQYIENEEI